MGWKWEQFQFNCCFRFGIFCFKEFSHFLWWTGFDLCVYWFFLITTRQCNLWGVRKRLLLLNIYREMLGEMRGKWWYKYLYIILLWFVSRYKKNCFLHFLKFWGFHNNISVKFNKFSKKQIKFDVILIFQ